LANRAIPDPFDTRDRITLAKHAMVGVVSTDGYKMLSQSQFMRAGHETGAL
jgi:hypothetical protein